LLFCTAQLFPVPKKQLRDPEIKNLNEFPRPKI